MKYPGSILFFLLPVLTSAISGCGNAKAIKSYRYQVTKYNLEKAVMKVIKSNPNIYLDTTEKKIIVNRYPGNNSDTTTDTINASEYHGPDRAEMLASLGSYATIKIKAGQIENDYVFRYYGNEKDWKSSPGSAIFISEAHDKYGNGLSQGHNEHGQFKSKMARGFTDLFEKELVNKVDKELSLKHTVD